MKPTAKPTDRGPWNYSALRRIVDKAESIRRESRRMRELHSHRATMIEYLRLRLDLEDWHGVMDAAADIREIEAEMRAVADCAPDETAISGPALTSPAARDVMRSMFAAETKRSAPGRSRGKEPTK